MEERDIRDVTFKLKVMMPSGCCVGIVKEIEPHYSAVENASRYRYFKVEGRHIFISREIKVLGPLTVITEGFWKMKRLSLNGAIVPI